MASGVLCESQNQMVDGHQVEVAGEFVLLGGDTYAFQITGEYDPARERIIDPELSWSTYLGGTNLDFGYGIALDSAGNVLVSGDSSGGDVCVVKLNPNGGHMWDTYMGVNRSDWADDIAVDSGGNILVTGYTFSADWTSSGFATSFNGNADAFVVKLSPNGGHLWGLPTWVELATRGAMALP